MTNTFDPGTKVPTYAPIWSTEMLELPKDRATLNAWARSFYALEPDVNRLINQHAMFIMNSFDLKECKSHKANQFFIEQFNILGLPAMLENMIIEYFVLGEVFLYLELSEAKASWSRLIIQNPDYIIVKRSVVSESKYYLRPDENLRRLCFSDRVEDKFVRNLLNPTIVETVKNGENILLDSFNTHTICHRMSPYEIRGTSFLTPLLLTLQKKDKSIEDKLIIRESLWDITAVENKTIGQDVLMMRYEMLVTSLENWFNTKLIAPVAKLQGFSTGTKVKKLVHPEVKFDRQKLKSALLKTINNK